jgi:sporulation protein YlmC with PRC-barrel domain
MLLSDKDFHGYSIRSLDNDSAGDNEVGKAVEFYFDDQTWTVRYVIVDTNSWLPGGKVLISPYSIKEIHPNEKTTQLSLTKDQVKDSPAINTEQPISRKQEVDLSAYYGWPAYWNGGNIWGNSLYPTVSDSNEGLKSQNESFDESNANDENSHLRSTSEVEGYHIMAIDREFGHVSDFILDEKTWGIKYLVIDTKNWWFGKKVLISPKWITEINWSKRNVKVDLSEEIIKNGPEYDSTQPIPREYEEELHRHYNKDQYQYRN